MKCEKKVQFRSVSATSVSVVPMLHLCLKDNPVRKVRKLQTNFQYSEIEKCPHGIKSLSFIIKTHGN